jgi:hypothetical protein
MENCEGTIEVCLKVRCYLRGLAQLLSARLACPESILDLVGIYWFSEEMQKQQGSTRALSEDSDREQ